MALTSIEVTCDDALADPRVYQIRFMGTDAVTGVPFMNVESDVEEDDYADTVAENLDDNYIQYGLPSPA